MMGSHAPASPMVSIIVPCRNEASDIDRALQRILDQDYPLNRMEVVVVDGDSDDDTAEIAKRVLDGSGLRRYEIVGNPERRTPSNLNRGLLWAEGDVVVRVDARSMIPVDYVRRTVAALGRNDVVVVGGSQVAIARDRSGRAAGIARALNNRFAMGWSRYRRPGAPSGPTDTVYLGVFDGKALRHVDGWSQMYSTNQDFELNQRMSAEGIVWFESGLEVEYQPRAGIAELWQQYHRFGRWKAFYWAQTGTRPQRRQLVLVAAPVLGAACAALIGHRVGWRWLATTGVVTTAAVEHVGSARPGGGPVARCFSIAAMAAVAGGWWSGVIRGLAKSGERPEIR